MNVCKIYTLNDAESGCVRYVGKTTQTLNNRLRAHLNDKGFSHKTNWIKSVSGKISINLIEECESQNWEDRERFWISHYRSIGAKITNQRDGGGGVGYQRGDARAKISQKLKGRKCPCSEKRAKAISDAKRGKPNYAAIGRVYSEEHRRNISRALIGRPSATKGVKQSAEHVSKRIAARIANKSFSVSLRVINKKTGSEYWCLAEASRASGIPKTTLRRLTLDGNSDWEIAR